MTKTIKSGILSRTMEIRSVDAEKRTVELEFSSEAHVERWGIVEILDHNPKSVRMERFKSGKAPLLLNHRSDEQIGVIESAEISGKVGKATVRFGKSAKAEEIFQDVKDGIRSCVSVGYQPHKYVQEEIEGKRTVYRATDWEPLEASIVPVPADRTVGIVRAAENEFEVIIETLKRGHDMSKPEGLPVDPTAQQRAADNVPPAVPQVRENNPAPAQIDLNKVTEDEMHRQSEIRAIASKAGLGDDLIDEHIKKRSTVEVFRKLAWDRLPEQHPIRSTVANKTASASFQLDAKDAKRYSLMNAVRSLCDNDKSQAKFEWEVSEAMRSASGIEGKAKGRGIIIPQEALVRYIPEMLRSQNVTSQTAGGFLTSETYMPDMFIEMLRNATQVVRAGATVMSGLEGSSVGIPKQSGGVSTAWYGEEEATDESEATFGKISMRPKKIKTKVKLTDEIMRQSSPSVEMIVRNDILKAIALGIDLAALRGSGVGEEPLGILNTTGIGGVSYTAGTPTYDKMVDLKSQVAIDNALFGQTAFLMNARDQGLLEKTRVDAGSGLMVWTYAPNGKPDEGRVVGQNAYITNQLANDKILFGNFADVIIGSWSGVELTVDPYTEAGSDITVIYAKQYVDIAVRRPESFAVSSAA